MALKINRIPYEIRYIYEVNKLSPFFARTGEIKHLKEMTRLKLVEVINLPGDLIKIRLLGAGQHLADQLNLEENNE
jgi:hypothetical protein